jgi:hypothetical protein
MRRRLKYGVMQHCLHFPKHCKRLRQLQPKQNERSGQAESGPVHMQAIQNGAFSVMQKLVRR